MNFFATLLVVGVLLSVNSMKAQDGSTDNVTLNIKLNPIQTLFVNPTQKEVNLEYKTKADYSGGVSYNEPNHLEIYSTGGFEIKAKASTSTLNSANTTVGNGMNVNTVEIIPSAGSKPLAGATYNQKSLSAEADGVVIISSTTGGVDRNFNIEYAGAGAEQYVNYYNNAENPTIYTTTVTYTIVAQ